MDASTFTRLRRNRALISNTYTKVPGVPSEIVMERAVGRQAFIQEKKLVQECCNPPEINYYVPFQINFLNGDDWEESTITLTFGCKGYIEFVLVDIPTSSIISSSIVFRFNSQNNEFTYSIPYATSTHRYILRLFLETDSSPLTDVTVSGVTVRRVTSFGNSSPGIYGSLDVSQCPKLQILDIAGSINLTSVNLGSPKTLLNTVFASASGITNLDVSGCTSLSLLDMLNCPSLESIDASGCTSLENLIAYNCPLLDDVNAANCNPVARIDLASCGFTTATANSKFANYLLAGPNPATGGIIILSGQEIEIVNPSNLYTLSTYGWDIDNS